MAAQSASSPHLEITETFVRLYVFLSQTLDRCLDQGQRESFPEKEHQAFLTAARNRMRDMLAVNPVVKSKVEEESGRVLALAESYLKKPSKDLAAQIAHERAALKTKLVALSDLLAVFRAL
ncbi:MAG: hypothetical protein EPO02_01465 [Nitrospirae bacterium]|nr:MAG: hypothetical protein EPO02_01465 [Nitrospirota bacterium]